MSNIFEGGGQSAPAIDDDALALGFFSRVLPATGVYCAAIKTKRGTFRNEFYTSHEALWLALRDADRSGVESYFTVASLELNASRAVANVEALQCLRVDVDFGEGHKAEVYATKAEALAAVKKFYTDAGLPSPLVVESGGGLHVYWPLEDHLRPEAWLPYAKGLKAACMQRRLRADHAVTANIAQILRAPCTTNRKLAGKPRKVELNPRFLEIEPYALAKFDGLLQYKIQNSRRGETGYCREHNPLSARTLSRVFERPYPARL